MNEPEQMTSERARRIDQGIDTALHFLHQAFCEDTNLLLDVPSSTTLSLHRELGQALEAAERTQQPVAWVPKKGHARRVRHSSNGQGDLQ